MAYGKKYEIRYKNRFQHDIYRDEIWEKDFAEDTIELIGAEQPFTISWQSGDTDILSPIKSAEFTLAFINKSDTYNLSIEDFYSDDDERFRIDHYFESYEDGSGTEKLLNTSYLIEDGATEPLTDRKHVISLKATDNLALLKSVKWNEIGVEYEGSFGLGYYVRYALKQTGLYSNDSLIDMSLPLRIYANIFENTIKDRSDIATAEPYRQIVLNSGLFKNSDNTWKNCYEVLETVLIDMNACIIQANGYWNIIRVPEYSLFTDGEIPGTEYIFNGSGTDENVVTLDPFVTIDRNGTQIIPIAEDQGKSIQRPLKSVKNTFNYIAPPLIKQADFQIPDDAIPYDTSTVGDFRYDRYDLATYFPDWVQRDGDVSYLEIVTNTTTTPENEVERYIVTPSADDTARGVQFNPIPITQGDVIDFSCQYRTATDTDNMLNFGVRFVIIGTAATTYLLIDFPSIIASPDPGLLWNDYPSTDWDLGDGVHAYISDADADDIDTTQYQSYSLSGFLGINRQLPQAPADGMLLVQVMGTNTYATSENTTTLWKDINLTVTNFVNQSIQIVGQTHLETGVSTIKATQENEITIDDSPRNSIAGTLFTDETTNFDHIDSTTTENTNIGNIYFTRTKLWHRAEIAEELRLGNIIVDERLLLHYTSRLIVEGSFKNLRYSIDDDDGFISLLSLFQFGFIAAKYFAPMSMNIDVMGCTFNTRLLEIFRDPAEGGELLANADVTNYSGTATALPLVFDDVVTAVNFSPNAFFTIFTYDGTPDIFAHIVLDLAGTWNVADAVNIDLKVNGVVVGTQALTMGGFTAHIEYDTTLSTNDTVSASIDWVGAITYDVDIDSGALAVTSSETGNEYLFNYIYEAK